MFARNIPQSIRSVFIGLCLFALCSVALAQSTATPIAMGHNAFGELTIAARTAQYSVSAQGGESVTIQMLALSSELVARFRLLNPSGVEILSVPNPTGLATLSANAVLGDAGVYIIEISGENNSLGQFALSLQAGPPPAPPVDLTVNTLVSNSVGSQTAMRVYQFGTTPADALALTILSQTSDAGPQISLFDRDTNKLLASNDLGFGGVSYHLPSQGRNYRLEVHASGASDTTYSVCLGDCGAATPTPTTMLTVTAAACTATARTAAAINVRSGPGTIYAGVGVLANQTLPVLGRYPGAGGWYQVSINGTTGWVAASVAKLIGDCTALAPVAPPVNAPLAPTPTRVFIPPTAQSQPNTQAQPTAVPTIAPPAVPLPDLTIRITAASKNPDGTVTLDLQVANFGDGPTDANDWNQAQVIICVDADCSPFAMAAILGSAPLAAGSYHNSLNFTLPIPASSTERLTLKITVTIDSMNVVKESKENNNIDSKTISNL